MLLFTPLLWRNFLPWVLGCLSSNHQRTLSTCGKKKQSRMQREAHHLNTFLWLLTDTCCSCRSLLFSSGDAFSSHIAWHVGKVELYSKTTLVLILLNHFVFRWSYRCLESGTGHRIAYLPALWCSTKSHFPYSSSFWHWAPGWMGAYGLMIISSQNWSLLAWIALFPNTLGLRECWQGPREAPWSP